jgi:hypothetical protein
MSPEGGLFVSIGKNKGYGMLLNGPLLGTPFAP